MIFKPGQWVVVNPNLHYWPIHHKEKLGPFQIKTFHEDGKRQWYQLVNAPNSVYTKDCVLYTPQVGDKVRILKPMNGFEHHPNILKDQTGKLGTITVKYDGIESSIAIRCEDDSHGWWYVNEENVYYELVEPQGSINVAARAPDAVKPQPTKRVLNA